jgi:hypothetical protein
MATGLWELESEFSGVAGDGDRDAVAVADDEDILWELMDSGDGGSDKPSIKSVTEVKASKKSQPRQVHSSHGRLHTCGVLSCLSAISTMKRGAEKQLSKDNDMDFEHEVRALDLLISYFANQLSFPGRRGTGQRFSQG